MLKKPPRTLTLHPIDQNALLVHLTKGAVAIISNEDAEVIGLHRWYYIPPRPGVSRTGYAARHTRRGTTSRQLLHRLVAQRMGLDMSGEIDHVNRDGLDCRRGNLRAVTRAQNAANCRVRSDSKTGIKGVSFDARRGRWTVRVGPGGPGRSRGSYTTLAEAEAVAETARTKLYGATTRPCQTSGP